MPDMNGKIMPLEIFRIDEENIILVEPFTALEQFQALFKFLKIVFPDIWEIHSRQDILDKLAQHKTACIILMIDLFGRPRELWDKWFFPEIMAEVLDVLTIQNRLMKIFTKGIDRIFEDVIKEKDNAGHK